MSAARWNTLALETTMRYPQRGHPAVLCPSVATRIAPHLLHPMTMYMGLQRTDR